MAWGESGRVTCGPPSVFVRSGEPAVAVLVLLARAAGAGLVAADLAPACRIVRIALHSGSRCDPVAHQRLRSGAGKRQLVLAGRGIDLVSLHVGQARLLLRRRPDLDAHEL